MLFEDLPTETVTQIFSSLPTVTSAIALSSTCHRFRHIFSSSKKSLIISQAADNEYGPIEEAVQLVTHNASQPAHIRRNVPLSDASIHSIIKVGRVAAQWEHLYPFKKWKADFENRRLSTDEERYKVRRAIYRLWLFTRAFHNPDHPRLSRSHPLAMLERASSSHNFSTPESAEMHDVHNILRDTIGNNICPSNGTIRRKFQKRFPDSTHQLLFNMHLPFQPPSTFVPSDTYYHSSPQAGSKFHAKFVPSRNHEPGAEGWGDDILHYYVVEDMSKLDPEQILWSKANAPFKGQVEAYVRSSGDWFENNGETFAQTLAFVVQQRGGEMEELKEAVEEGEMGGAVLEGDGVGVVGDS